MKHTKIVATIGPACDSLNTLTAMLKSGMNLARINFSHGTHASNKQAIDKVKLAAKKLNLPVGIIQDLQGPRIRIGEIDKKGLELIHDEEIFLYPEGKKITRNGHKILPVDLPKLIKILKPGSQVMVHDGLIELKVISVNHTYAKAKVIKGGMLFSNKGVNLPGVDLKMPVITKKDIDDLKFGLKIGVDYVALSFVGSAKDIIDLRKLIKKFNPKSKVQIMAKIEREQAVKNIKAIIKEVDAIMVARGDLGVEMSPEKVPIIQKEIVRLCLEVGKPVLVATQMLDSMIKSPRPTRAEVSDVANAVIDHTDGVMLSGETAFGQYPLESVKMMNQIIEETEKSTYDDMRPGYFKERSLPITKAISGSVFDLVKDTNAKAIVAATDSGYTAKMIARYRPDTKIIVLVNSLEILRQLTLVWGVYPRRMPVCKTMDELIVESIKIVKKEKLVKKGDEIVIVTGQPVGKSQNMNLIKVQTIE